MNKIIRILLFIQLIVSLPPEILYSQIILWEESFEYGNIFERGWKFVNNDSSATVPEIYTPFDFINLGYQNGENGNHFYMFTFDDANYRNIADDWFITPRLFDIHKGDSISFWCGAINKKFSDSLKVFISTSNNSLEAFQLIDHFEVQGPVGSWHKKIYDLSAYSGKNVYFAVNYYMKNAGPLGTSSDVVWIDNFKLTGKGHGGIEPTSFELQQNFPNPFNPSTEISFSVPFDSHVSITIYETSGRELLKVIDNNFEKGRYSVTLNADNLSSGVYFYSIKAEGPNGNFSDTKKMTVVK